MTSLCPEDITSIFRIFTKENPNPLPELTAPNEYTFLVSVVLSAQATDKSVNLATEALYKIADTPEKMLALGQEKLEQYIHSIGLYRNKAKNIIALSQTLVDKYNSRIPETREELISLKGVGRKTANVVLNAVFSQKTMPVDTHILRVSARIGLSDGTSPEKVEQDLLKCIPDKYLKNAHHHLLLHGRYVCTARKPHCETCLIARYCMKNL